MTDQAPHAPDIGMVRTPTPDEFDAIMSLCRLMHAENLMHSFNEPKVSVAVKNAINMDGGIIGVVGDPGPVGVIILRVGSDWYSDDKYLYETMFFVHSDHRRSSYAKTLLAWAKHVADRMGMMFLSEVHGRKQADAKIALFDRHFDRLGSVFVHNRHHASMVASEQKGAA